MARPPESGSQGFLFWGYPSSLLTPSPLGLGGDRLIGIQHGFLSKCPRPSGEIKLWTTMIQGQFQWASTWKPRIHPVPHHPLCSLWFGKSRMPHGTWWKFPLLVVPSLSSSFFFFFFYFWSEPTSQTIRDWIILAAGLCFHIRAPWKGLITIWSIVQFPSISPRTLRSVQRERRAATNGVWTIINSSSSFIVFISFEVEISSLYLCFIYSFFFISPSSLFFVLTAIQSSILSTEVLPTSVGKVCLALAVWSIHTSLPACGWCICPLKVRQRDLRSLSWLAAGWKTSDFIQHFQ